MAHDIRKVYMLSVSCGITTWPSWILLWKLWNPLCGSRLSRNPPCGSQGDQTYGVPFGAGTWLQDRPRRPRGSHRHRRSVTDLYAGHLPRNFFHVVSKIIRLKGSAELDGVDLRSWFAHALVSIPCHTINRIPDLWSPLASWPRWGRRDTLYQVRFRTNCSLFVQL